MSTRCLPPTARITGYWRRWRLAINPSGDTLLLGSTGFHLDDVACLQQTEDAGQDDQGQRYFQHVRREIDDLRQLDTSARGPGPVPVAVLNTKVLQLPASLAGRCSLLRLEGADYFPHTWVSGHHAGGHEGFFGPFQLDISPFVRHGDRNVVRLTVTSANDPSGAGISVASDGTTCTRLPPFPNRHTRRRRPLRRNAGTLRKQLASTRERPCLKAGALGTAFSCRDAD
ncbi:MAG TPA: hypothetical protein VGV63_05775 [Acidimicrobiales bacterium]|nr:hypothetical protein [Acidimicrobiales bacterium]